LSDFISLWQKYQGNIAQQKSRPLERPAAEYIHITSANWDQRFSLSHLYAPYRNANVIIEPNIVLKFYRYNNTKKIIQTLLIHFFMNIPINIWLNQQGIENNHKSVRAAIIKTTNELAKLPYQSE